MTSRLPARSEGRAIPIAMFFVLIVLAITFVLLFIYSIDEAGAQAGCGPQVRVDEYGRPYHFFVPCEQRGGQYVAPPDVRPQFSDRPRMHYPMGYPYFGVPREQPHCYGNPWARGCGP